MSNISLNIIRFELEIDRNEFILYSASVKEMFKYNNIQALVNL